MNQMQFGGNDLIIPRWGKAEWVYGALEKV